MLMVSTVAPMLAKNTSIYAIGEVAQHKGIVYGLVAPGYDMATILAQRLCKKGDAVFTSGDVEIVCARWLVLSSHDFQRIMLYLWQFIIADILFGLLELEAIAFKLSFPFIEPVETRLVFVGGKFAVARDIHTRAC